MNVKPFSHPLPPSPAKPKSNAWLFVCLFLVIAVVILNKVIGVLSYNFFVSGDHFLHLTKEVSPFVMWGIAGIFPGAMIGGFVVSKKYKLPFKWNLPAVFTFLLVGSILYLISGQLNRNHATTLETNHDGSDLVEIISSRSLPDYNGHHYGPAGLLDSDYNTAWMYIETKGRSESVSYVFNDEKVKDMYNLQLVGIRINPGYTKTFKKWKQSNKPKGYVIYKNGNEIVSGDFNDLFGYQVVSTGSVELKLGDTVRVSVISSYKPVSKKVNIIAITGMYPIVNYKAPKL